MLIAGNELATPVLTNRTLNYLFNKILDHRINRREAIINKTINQSNQSILLSYTEALIILSYSLLPGPSVPQKSLAKRRTRHIMPRRYA